MGYGAPRVIYKGTAKTKPVVEPQEPVATPVIEPAVIEPIEEDVIPETAETPEVLIPTTFVKKTEEADVNQYVRRRK